jgi:hypothetical protein
MGKIEPHPAQCTAAKTAKAVFAEWQNLQIIVNSLTFRNTYHNTVIRPLGLGSKSLGKVL